MSDAHGFDDQPAKPKFWKTSKQPTVVAQRRGQQRHRLIAALAAILDNGATLDADIDARDSFDDATERAAGEGRERR
jgi:hypothetical protein